MLLGCNSDSSVAIFSNTLFFGTLFFYLTEWKNVSLEWRKKESFFLTSRKWNVCSEEFRLREKVVELQKQYWLCIWLCPIDTSYLLKYCLIFGFFFSICVYNKHLSSRYYFHWDYCFVSWLHKKLKSLSRLNESASEWLHRLRERERGGAKKTWKEWHRNRESEQLLSCQSESNQDDITQVLFIFTSDSFPINFLSTYRRTSLSFFFFLFLKRQSIQG